MNVLRWFGRAWVWVKAHSLALLGGAILLAGAYLLYRRQQGRIASLADALAVERARRDVAVLQARRDALVASADARDPQIQEIDERLRQNKRDAVAAVRRVEELDDDEVAGEFERLGF